MFLLLIPSLVEQELCIVGFILGVLLGTFDEHVLAVVHNAVEDDDAGRFSHRVNGASPRLRVKNYYSFFVSGLVRI